MPRSACWPTTPPSRSPPRAVSGRGSGGRKNSESRVAVSPATRTLSSAACASVVRAPARSVRRSRSSVAAVARVHSRTQSRNQTPVNDGIPSAAIRKSVGNGASMRPSPNGMPGAGASRIRRHGVGGPACRAAAGEAAASARTRGIDQR